MTDFAAINWRLMDRVRSLLPLWLPSGKFQGNEYICADITGGVGKSFCVSLVTGAWMDHANPDHKGGDLISLYAKQHNLKQSEAAEELEGPKLATQEFTHHNPFWTYRASDGTPLFHVTRGMINGKKTYAPYTWDGTKWKAKAYPDPRPLYNLPALTNNPTGAVLIVEGEKSADAAAQILKEECIVTTWAHGAQAVHKNDWKPLHGRKVMIWPDADEPGSKAARDIAALLSPYCNEIRIIRPHDHTDGWDAADALAEGMDYEKFKAWAGDKLTVYVPNPEEAIVPANASLNAIWEVMGLVKNARGIPVSNLDNGFRALDYDPKYKGKIWWDDFHQKIYSTLYSETPREWSDIDTFELLKDFQSRIGLYSFTSETITHAVYLLSSRDKRNEPRDWMSSLKWDGEDRLTHFFENYFGSPCGPYFEALGKNFFIAMVARIFCPGCQADNMVILEGPQGTFKTSALRVIGGPWHVSMSEAISSGDFVEVFQGKMIVEIAEMESFSKAETSKIKAMLTVTSDRYRKKYGRHAEEHPRQCIFVGTTNDSNYLKDSTGLRRFWPLTVKHININQLIIDRPQLFAEALHRLNAGETWHVMPHTETVNQQELRRSTDPWEEIVETYVNQYFTPGVGFNATEVATTGLNIPIERMDKKTSMRVGAILHRIGCEQKVSRVDGKSQRRWFLPER